VSFNGWFLPGSFFFVFAAHCDFIPSHPFPTSIVRSPLPFVPPRIVLNTPGPGWGTSHFPPPFLESPPIALSALLRSKSVSPLGETSSFPARLKPVFSLLTFLFARKCLLTYFFQVVLFLGFRPIPSLGFSKDRPPPSRNIFPFFSAVRVF